MQKLRSKADLSGEALQKKALDEMCLPAVGCFVAGTLVHTKDGLKPIEQIKIGDWVLSRPAGSQGQVLPFAPTPHKLPFNQTRRSF